IADQRYGFIERVVEKAVTKKAAKHSMSLSDKIDSIVTHRVLALPIFAGIMFLMYAIAMGSYSFSIGTMGTDWANDVLFGEIVPGIFDSVLTGLGVSGWLYDLIMNGILAGVGAVLGFVPQILVLCFLLALLEDVGYMSRVAFIMDRLLRRFGLSGKSIIPMLVATGCGVPGILASRTIEQERDRKITVMTTGFIPCGAKMPIIGLFAGAVFGNSPLVAVSAFFIGVAAVVISGVILKKFKALAGKPAPFVMELPTYHLPSPRNVLRSTMDRGWDFVKRATTIILVSSIVLWFLQSYGFTGGSFGVVEDNNHSLLATLGKMIAWIFYPLGWAGEMAWKAAVATITGLIAKEEVVMTFGTLYNQGAEISEVGNEIWSMIAADFGPVRAYSFMIFNLLCAPCFAAMGAIKREMNDTRWTIATIAYMCGFAYVISMIVYQFAGLMTGEASFGIFTVAAAAALAALLYLIFRKGYQADSRHNTEISASARK
ncbi:MAG: ferrous iron transporter B, partial [Clostridia bacterium]|nr:ferrous iron transporter B [Clostridia bacterium]